MPLSKHKYIALIQQPGQEIIFYTPPDCVTMTSQSKSALRKTNTFGWISIENNMITSHHSCSYRSYGLSSYSYCHSQPQISPSCFPCLYQYFIYLPGNDILRAPQNICYFCAMLQWSSVTARY